jgi:hypothetical protein
MVLSARVARLLDVYPTADRLPLGSTPTCFRPGCRTFANAASSRDSASYINLIPDIEPGQAVFQPGSQRLEAMKIIDRLVTKGLTSNKQPTQRGDIASPVEAMLGLEDPVADFGDHILTPDFMLRVHLRCSNASKPRHTRSLLLVRLPPSTPHFPSGLCFVCPLQTIHWIDSRRYSNRACQAPKNCRLKANRHTSIRQGV